MILTKCPLRISLVGGSTDTVSFLEKFHKGSVISFTPNLYTYVSIHQNNVERYIINCSLREDVSKIEDIKNDIIKECLQCFNTPPCTVSFNTNILSSGSGLASSSSFIISMIKAICLFQNVKMNNKKICDLAFNIEQKINPLAGYQDVYGCGVGNFKRIDFSLNKQEVYKFLDLSFILDSHNMFLINTGITRKSTKILKTLDVDKSYYLLSTVDKLENCIIEKNVSEFFNIFNKGWEIKKTTSNEIMNSASLLELESYLINSKMIKGLKLCGAGGGGYFFIFIEKENTIKFKNYFRQRYKDNPLIHVDIENNGVVGAKI